MILYYSYYLLSCNLKTWPHALDEGAGTVFASFEVLGQMDRRTWHSVQYRPARHTPTTSPSQAREELCCGMLTSHGWELRCMALSSSSPGAMNLTHSQSPTRKWQLFLVTHHFKPLMDVKFSGWHIINMLWHGICRRVVECRPRGSDQPGPAEWRRPKCFRCVHHQRSSRPTVQLFLQRWATVSMVLLWQLCCIFMIGSVVKSPPNNI